MFYNSGMELDDVGVLRLALAVCLLARRDADAGDNGAAEFLRGDFAYEVRSLLETRHDLLSSLCGAVGLQREVSLRPPSSRRVAICRACGSPFPDAHRGRPRAFCTVCRPPTK